MRSHYGAEIRKLVRFYILYIFGKEQGAQNIGFSRDDGLACLLKISGQRGKKYGKISPRIFGRTSTWKYTLQQF